MGGVLSYKHMDIVQLCSARFSSNLVWVEYNFLRIKKYIVKRGMGANRVSTENNRILIHVQGLQISEGFCLHIRVPFIVN